MMGEELGDNHNYMEIIKKIFKIVLFGLLAPVMVCAMILTLFVDKWMSLLDI